MKAPTRWLVSLAVLALARTRGAAADGRSGPPEPDGRAELAVTGLLGLAALAAGGFVAVYVLGAGTQLLGVSIGLALAFLGLALAIASRRLVPQETHVEPLPEPEHPEDAAAAAEALREGTAAISRRRLLRLAAGGAIGALGAAVLVPLASLGPALETGRLRRTPWRRGRRVVTGEGEPIRPGDLNVGSFVLAFPAGASTRTLDGPIVLVRVRQEELELPAGRETWHVDGVLGFSRTCPHAACAVSLFRYPAYEPTSAGPALVCPCHYSTFDVVRGGDVVFGPAGRPLPQLPLAVDDEGFLVAGGDFSEPPGPSWWGVRL